MQAHTLTPAIQVSGAGTERAQQAERAGWKRVPDQSGESTAIPRLEQYRFHSRVLPEPEDRCVQVYLPPQYESSPEARFPVFYLQDGQNLFDPETSYVPGQTWHAHTTADRLAESGEMEPVILVGVANAGLRRMAEYTPGRDVRMGGGEGRSYARLLLEELKPLVDATYRTCADAENTAVGGSSLGGLISLSMALERPEVIGKVAAMSPSVWWDQRSILRQLDRATPRPAVRVWIDIGTVEGSRHMRDVGMLVRQMLRQGWHDGVDLKYEVVEGGEHNEQAWAARFDGVLRFLFPVKV